MPIPEGEQLSKRMSAKDLVYHTLCDWIITGKMQPGEKIVDSQLAEFFHVSRTPVREAIQHLEKQKLVRIVPGCATIVTELDLDDMEKCYRIIACLHSLAAELTCSYADEAAKHELIHAFEKYETACNVRDSQQTLEWDNRFHQIIVKAAHNEYIEEFSALMLLHIQRIKYHYFRSDRARKASLAEHREILYAICAWDAQGAKRATRNHWLRVMDESISGIAVQLKNGKEIDG